MDCADDRGDEEGMDPKDDRLMKPGDTVEFTLTFTGKFVRARGKYVVVRTNRGSHQIPVDNIVRVIDPEPDEAEVIKIARCSACDRTPGVSCVHKQT